MSTGVIMGIPLAILAVLCIVGGFLDLPRTLGGSPLLTKFLEITLPGSGPETPLSTDAILQLVSEALSFLGIPVGWLLARRGASKSALSRFLTGGLGFDWVYDRVFVRPFVSLWEVNKRDVADRIPDGVGGLSMLLSRVFRWTQNGRVRWYAAGVALGAALVIAAAVML